MIVVQNVQYNSSTNSFVQGVHTILTPARALLLLLYSLQSSAEYQYGYYYCCTGTTEYEYLCTSVHLVHELLRGVCCPAGARHI